MQGSLVLLSFSYISLSRLVSISIYEEVNETILVLVFTNAPLLIGLIECLKSMEIPLKNFYFPVKNWWREAIIASTGLIFGIIEISLIKVKIIPAIDIWTIISSSIAIIVLTGFYEELLFRGIIFKYLADVGSTWFALVYSALLFSVMHIAWHSFIDLIFVFSVGFIYGWIYTKNRSLLGISISHGLTNIVLFLK